MIRFVRAWCLCVRPIRLARFLGCKNRFYHTLLVVFTSQESRSLLAESIPARLCLIKSLFWKSLLEVSFRLKFTTKKFKTKQFYN